MKQHQPVVHTLSMPEYGVQKRPDYALLGPQLDEILVRTLPHRRPLALRGIDLLDLPLLSRADLVATIPELGTDRYNPGRAFMHSEYFDPLGVELYAVPWLVSDAGIERLIDPDYLVAESFGAEFMADFCGQRDALLGILNLLADEER